MAKFMTEITLDRRVGDPCTLALADDGGDEAAVDLGKPAPVEIGGQLIERHEITLRGLRAHRSR
jgi:hypothetical protein